MQQMGYMDLAWCPGMVPMLNTNKLLGHAPLIFSMADLWRGSLVQSVGRYIKIKKKFTPTGFFSYPGKLESVGKKKCWRSLSVPQGNDS